MIAISGYANRVLTLDFPDLSEDWENDPIRVVIRNPRTMSSGELTPKNLELDAAGVPVSEAEATNEAYTIIARLIVGWRVYDATSPIVCDVNGNVVSDQELLPQVFTADTVAKLPIDIISKINKEMTEAINPQ